MRLKIREVVEVGLKEELRGGEMRFSLLSPSSLQEAGSHPRLRLFVLIPACWPTYSCSAVWNVHHLTPALSDIQLSILSNSFKMFSDPALMRALTLYSFGIL